MLERYLVELELWNARLRLVDANGEELFVRHVLDCAAGARVIGERRGGKATDLVDLGSGAGFPGMVLAAAFPEWRVVLVERSGRACGFLRNAIAVSGAVNVEVLESEFESIDRTFDVVTFRAFRPISRRVVEGLARITRRDGFVAAYKAKRTMIDAELSGLSAAGLPVSGLEIVAVSPPFDAERNVVFFTPFSSGS